MNIALDGESPYDNHDLFRYLQRHMSVMKSTTNMPWAYKIMAPDGLLYRYAEINDNMNVAFYTTDGMRFEMYANTSACTPDSEYMPYFRNRLHESGVYAHICNTLKSGEINHNFKCGSYGLANNPNNLTASPCVMAVDVNGDRKPYPANVYATSYDDNVYRIPFPNDKKVKDLFGILITEDRAIPYGVLAQKAMYQAQK